MIIDSQVHTWSRLLPGRVPSPGRDPRTIRPGSRLPTSELLRLMKEAGVDQVLIYPPRWSDGGLGEALDDAKAAAGRVGVVPVIEPSGVPVVDGPTEVDPGVLAVSAGQIECVSGMPSVMAVRIVFDSARNVQRGSVEDAAHWVWGELADTGMRTMLTVRDKIEQLELIVQAHPKLRVALDGLGVSPDVRDERAWQRLERVLTLSRNENVCIKASNLPRLTSEAYPFRPSQGMLRSVLDAFGPRRVFWGSNVSIVRCSYIEALSMIEDAMPCLTTVERELVLGEGLRQWLEWE
jgi:L-fuconolactonase